MYLKSKKLVHFFKLMPLEAQDWLMLQAIELVVITCEDDLTENYADPVVEVVPLLH